ncbi:MAG: hypothetical protein AAGH65_09615 [Pseudomonadota bacterium]
MKTDGWPGRLGLGSALLLAATLLGAQSGGDFEVVRSTLDGGGGPSSGGPYELSGTIAQPEADPNMASGGIFSLRGGFYLDGLVDETLIFKDGFER